MFGVCTDLLILMASTHTEVLSNVAWKTNTVSSFTDGCGPPFIRLISCEHCATHFLLDQPIPPPLHIPSNCPLLAGRIIAKRNQILARRQAERDERKAADQAADVARGLEEERLRQEELERMDDEAGEKDKEALETAQAAAAAKKQKQKDLSRSPPRER